MILRLTVSPTAAVAKNAFVHEAKVALTVRHVFDFRSYSKLDMLFPMMRSLLWEEFGEEIEISRFFETANPVYSADDQDFNLLWEWLESVYQTKFPVEIPEKMPQGNLQVHISEPDIDDPGF